MNRIFIPALLALALTALGQERFDETIDVNAVLLDVIVTDGKGNQILGLGKDDFIVTENGVQQEIDSVDYVSNRILLDSREKDAPFKVERTTRERYFVFFFDRPGEPGLLIAEMMSARDAVRNFIQNEMKENDRVAIVGHDVRLKIYSDFSNDPETLEKALAKAAGFGPGITEAPAGDGPSILRAVDDSEMMRRTGTVYEALTTLGDALSSIKARKNLVIFSVGMADHAEDVRDGMLMGRSPDVDPMLEALNAANVTVYPVQLQREVITEPAFHQRLNELAESTGGRYHQLNVNFRNAIEEIENTNSGYYLVTYRSRHPRGEQGFQKVAVDVRNPEMRVVARSGYQYGS
jgi:VWFA-related protein